MKLRHTIGNNIVNFLFVSVAGIFFVWGGLMLIGNSPGSEKAVLLPDKTTPSPSISIPTIEPTPEYKINLLDKIQEGIQLLKSSQPLKYETQKGNSNILTKKQISLAILNFNTGEIIEKRIWVNEQDINNFKITGIVPIEPEIADDTIEINVKQWNSFNSFFDIIGQTHLIIVANKYLLQSTYLNSLPERSTKKYSEIIYVPYSSALHRVEIIDAGKKYLNEVVDEAFSSMGSTAIESRSLPGQLVTSVVTKEFIKNILVIEHIDPDSYLISGDNGKELAERMLTIIGLNQEKAYRYTGSPAGASGLAQFISSTYKKLLSDYPLAELNKDYYLGMADHLNAIKAMILFFDSNKYEIQRKINQPIIITEEMLAASYNGGATPVISSINKYGNEWLSKQLNLSEEDNLFRAETINYIKKFRSIKNLKLFE